MKRGISLFLALALAAALALPAGAAEDRSFSDVEGHYAKEAVETWSSCGVLKGYLDGTFRPDAPVTRSELAAVLDRVMGYQNTVENTFADVPDKAWYTQNILHLAAEGIFQGSKGGRMLPTVSMTRQEAFTALARSLCLEESKNAPGFADDEDIADWAKGYAAAMREAGYIKGDKADAIHPGDPITRAEVATVLSRMAAAFVNKDGTYSADCAGNLIVNAQDVHLKDMAIEGDLIVADGVGNGDVSLEKVTVKGDIILRGCGENSFHILPGCTVKNIIVTKTTNGRIRLVNESGKTIPMVYISDGRDGVTLDGGELGSVIIACDAPVTINTEKVDTVSVNDSAKVTVAKGSTISSLEVTSAAEDAQITVEGKVNKVTNDAGVKIDNKGAAGSPGGSGSGSGTSGGGGSSGGSSTPSKPITLTKVSLQLLAPSFGNVPDTADVLDKGCSAKTEWFNADGSAPTYRWKEDSTARDTFTADHAYQAVVTLKPTSGYVFEDTVQISVTDGNGSAFTPAKSEKNGDNWVVTMVYEKTQHQDPVSGVTVVAPAAVDLGGSAVLKVSYWNNLLVGPDNFAYQWYKCGDASGNEKAPIPGATGKEYTIPAADTQTEGNIYYCCDMTILGKVYPSSVRAIEVHNALDAGTIPIPTLEKAPFVDSSGRWVTVEVGDLMCHKDVSYCVTVKTEIKKKGGAGLGASAGLCRFDYQTVPEDGHVSWRLDLTDSASQFIFAMLKAKLSYDLELGEVTVTVSPELKGSELPELAQERTFDMTGQGTFRIFAPTDNIPDELWQGPPRTLQLVVRSATGTFVDKTDPANDPVPTEKYEQVMAIFRTSQNWIDGVSEGHWESDWNGRLYVPRAWLDGFETGSSMPQVICVFYAADPSTGEMNAYGAELKMGNIIFEPENE